jgi:peptide/nickel transport system ATP-binding protein
LNEVGIEGAAARAADYPHMFSGGMRQRVMIAAALACDPILLIADEPTSGLDADLKEQIFTLLARLRADRRLAVLLISHDMSLVARHADRASVFYAGRCVETGPAASMLRSPRHRYTCALLRAAPRLGGGVPAAIRGAMPEPEAFAASCRFAPRCDHAQAECVATAPALTAAPDDEGHIAACFYPATTPVAGMHVPSAAAPSPALSGESLRVEGLTVRYRRGYRSGTARVAVQDVSFQMAPGECLGVVGASGSGKTSLAHAIVHMVPYEGRVLFRGEPLSTLRGAALRRMQLVFQNPAASLDPIQTAGAAIEEALELGGLRDRRQRRARATALLEQVGLANSLLDRLPGTLSGGQAQRVAIARALAAEPALLVLDEPTASLDVSTAAGLLTLLRDLAVRLGVGYIVITHDVAVASVLAHRVAVMQNGRLVEIRNNVPS